MKERNWATIVKYDRVVTQANYRWHRQFGLGVMYSKWDYFPTFNIFIQLYDMEGLLSYELLLF